jgi:hypothetical protein
VLDLQVVLHPNPVYDSVSNPKPSLNCHSIIKVFPAMSKHHSHLLQMFNNTVAGYDRIWQVAMNVWKGITSAMVSRAFVLAYRIMRKIIEENGNNVWLCHGTPHCFVRRDFVDTFDGIVPCKVVEPTVQIVVTDTGVNVQVDM